MKMIGERYTAIECQAEIDKFELLSKTNPNGLRGVLQNAQGLLHSSNER